MKIYHTDIQISVTSLLYENECSQLAIYIILSLSFENEKEIYRLYVLSPFRQEIDHMNHEKLRRLAKEAFLEVLNLSDEQVNQF